jgi:serine/threonine-protein kinase
VLSSDVCDFLDAVQDGHLALAASLYRGEFLDGFHITGAPDFEHWVDDQRLRFAHMAIEVLEQLAAQALARDDPRSAVTALRRLAAIQPLDPMVAADLMQAMIAAGDLSGALAHAQVYEKTVRRELGIGPGPVVASLIGRIRSGEFGFPGQCRAMRHEPVE